MRSKQFYISWGPNILTCLRCILGVWIGIRLRHHLDFTLVALFLCAMFTDVLDGWWARSCKVTSKLGAVLDPLADKIMIISILYALVKRNVLPEWFLFTTIIKEAGLVFAGMYGIHMNKRISLKAMFWGKLAMFAQCFLIVLAMARIYYAWYHVGYDIYVGIVAALMGIAFFAYMLRAKGARL